MTFTVNSNIHPSVSFARLQRRARSLEIEGQILSVVQAGPVDRMILLIHGNSSCKEVFVAQIGPLLEAGFGVILLDLPGHGCSSDAPQPQRDYTIASYAKLLAKVCARLGARKPVLCGWSLGGHIAMQMAGDDPEYSGLVIFGAPPVGPGLQHLDAAFLPLDVGGVTGEQSPSEERLGAYLEAVYGSLVPVPEFFIRAAHRADGLSRSVMWEDWAQGAAGHDQTQVISNWPHPLLILHGAKDALISERYFHTLKPPPDHRKYRFSVLDSVGHAVCIEAPRRFNAELIKFCQSVFKP